VEAERNKCALRDRDGIPEDVAQAVTFLSSDAAGFITGENVKIDGGRGFGVPN
jgi:NAD(P)-dependent dehydrogenase (short-subunit alcohol dehydrogenase family)